MPLRIIIVGGVAGGMSAAARARRLDEGASIMVLERGSFVSYANCGVPYALGGVIESDTSLVLQTDASLEARFNIDIRLRSELVKISPQEHEVNIHDLQSGTFYKISYDKLILAQGAESVRPAIPGANLPRIFTLQTITDLQRIREFHIQK
jgi:NADPH-dependent 2,4-dienoyl-CoA reductase/sulfur reductase-like enzyme